MNSLVRFGVIFGFFLKEGGHVYVYNVRVKLHVFYCEVYEYKCGGLVIRNTN